MCFKLVNSVLPLRFLYVISSILLVSGCRQAESTEEWKNLFDGATTEGWQTRDGNTSLGPGWTVSDGVLRVHGGEDSVRAGDIMTTEEYVDFVLEWEWKMLTKGGNSGVKYFVKKEDADYDRYGPGLEYQLLDDDNHEWMLAGKMQPGDYHTLAALYELYPAANRKVNPLGQWNNSRIVTQGKHVEHWLNGVKVLEFERGSEDFRKRVSASKFAKHKDYGEPQKGYILLQDHGSKMEFRNIRIKPVR